tara:strand:+ start:8980 stop:9489 length:510 start_codon:yes stop_codon:yes gene_type:complete
MMDNIMNEEVPIFFKINKIDFFSKLKKLYKNSLSILEKFKEDYKDLDVTLNKKNISNSYEFLENINNNFNIYLEKILLICSKSIFTIIVNQIRNKIDNNLHIIPHNILDNFIKINITLTHFIKQIYISNKFNIIKIDDNANIIYKKPVLIEFVIDISNSEDVIVSIKYI